MMYLEHFGLNETPFRITPHTDFFFSGANRGATLEALVYAILNDQGIVRVSGEVGSGKTMLCRMLAESLPEHVDTIYLANPLLTRDEIVYALADELHIKLEVERPGALLSALQAHLIERHGAGRHVVALIDEAHAMPAETLEQIRLLSNLETSRHKLLQIVLFGQPELDTLLDRADMRQLKDRITHSFRLEPLVREDVDAYLDFRMRAAGYRGPKVFSAAAVRQLAAASNGLTRRINILADKALLAAFAGNRHEVTPDEVKAAVRDTDFPAARGAASWRRRAGPIAAAAGLAALIAAGALRLLPGAPSAPAAAANTASPVVSQPALASPPATEAPLATSRELAADARAPGNPADTPASTASAGPVSDQNAAVDPRVAALGAELAVRVGASEAWRRQANPERWIVQLATADLGDRDALRRYVERAARQLDNAQLRVFVDHAGAQNRAGIIYGEFATAEEARAALRAIPDSLRGRGAYVRQIASIR